MVWGAKKFAKSAVVKKLQTLCKNLCKYFLHNSLQKFLQKFLHICLQIYLEIFNEKTTNLEIYYEIWLFLAPISGEFGANCILKQKCVKKYLQKSLQKNLQKIV